MGSDEGLIRKSLERVKAAAEGRLEEFVSKLDVDSQVYTFWLALLALREAGSVRLLDKLIERELELARKHLRSEDDRDVLEIAESLGLRVSSKEIRIPVFRDKRGRLYYKILSYAIPVRDFLRVSARFKEDKLKLVNMPVRDGMVYLDGETLRELVLAAFKARLIDKLKELETPETQAFRQLVTELKREEALAVSGFDESSLPTCIRELLEKARRSELSDVEVHTILSFLRRVEAPRAFVVDVLGRLGVTDSGLAEVIASALEEVDSPGPLKCEELKRRGVCGCEKDLTLEYLERRARASQIARERS